MLRYFFNSLHNNKTSKHQCIFPEWMSTSAIKTASLKSFSISACWLLSFWYVPFLQMVYSEMKCCILCYSCMQRQQRDSLKNLQTYLFWMLVSVDLNIYMTPFVTAMLKTPSKSRWGRRFGYIKEWLYKGRYI